MPNKQSDKVELARRVEAVRRLIGQAWSRYEICQFASKNWQVDFRTADRYIAEARVSMLAEIAKDRSAYIAEHVEFRRDIRRKAIEAKKYRDALAAAQDEAKLMDLYPADRQENKHEGELTLRVIYDTGNGASTTDDGSIQSDA